MTKKMESHAHTERKLKFNRNYILILYALADKYNCWQRKNASEKFQARKAILKKRIQKSKPRTHTNSILTDNT